MVTNIFVSYLRKNFSKIVRIRFDVAIDERASSRYRRGGRGGRGGGERERVKERKKEALYTLAFG